MNTDRLIDRIYEAALITEGWPNVLDDLAQLAGGLGTIMFTAKGEDTYWISSEATADAMRRFVADGWANKNTRGARLIGCDHPGFVTDLDVFTRNELDLDPVYTQALRPYGLGWGAATAIPIPSGELIVFSIEREFANGPVDRERIAPLDKLRPHLARSALLSARFALVKAQRVVDTLKMVGLPAAVVNSKRRVLAHNDLFVLMDPQVRIGAQDVLGLNNSSANHLLEKSLTSMQTLHGGGYSLPVPAQNGNAAAVIHLLPFRGGAQDIFTGGSCLVLANRIDTVEFPSATIIQALFDLSPAEVRVARLILEGKNLAQCAAQLKVSKETVRSQLKAVFSKTGRNSQASLVSLLSRVRAN